MKIDFVLLVTTLYNPVKVSIGISSSITSLPGVLSGYSIIKLCYKMMTLTYAARGIVRDSQGIECSKIFLSIDWDSLPSIFCVLQCTLGMSSNHLLLGTAPVALANYHVVGSERPNAQFLSAKFGHTMWGQRSAEPCCTVPNKVLRYERPYLLSPYWTISIFKMYGTLTVWLGNAEQVQSLAVH